jgi:uncharacterized membrane protein YhhN
MKKVALITFVMLSLGELGAIVFDYNEVHHICKPLLMVSLIGYYWIASEARRSLTLVASLFASCAGDILLMFAENDERYFIPGLVAFLVTHVLLIFAFKQHRRENAGNTLRSVQSIRMAFPVVLAGTGLIVILYPSLGDLKIPVVAYAIVLILMVLGALYRYGRTNFKSMTITFAGAMLFMISDATLAINKFLMPIPHAGLWIMTTYIIAQFLIVRGLLDHDK